MPNMSHIDNDATAPGDLQWLPVISNVAVLRKYPWSLLGRQG
jgi:hypothetical protein